MPYALDVPKTQAVRCSEMLNASGSCGWSGRRVYDYNYEPAPCPKCEGQIEVGIRRQDYDGRYRVLWQDW